LLHAGLCVKAPILLFLLASFPSSSGLRQREKLGGCDELLPGQIFFSEAV